MSMADNRIRSCSEADLPAMLEIINDAATAYKGIIPADRWHEPYMPLEELQHEIAAGVRFWGYEEQGRLLAVMGIQDKGEVTLIRHAYVRTARRGQGLGTRLLCHLESTTQNPILIGTWAAATWAVAFYQKNGYRLLPEDEKNRLLRRYWTIPERQVETSVVLAKTGRGCKHGEELDTELLMSLMAHHRA
jgi:GNAT superfamily N-acetyltransferase